jgi:hypothetical protein
MSSKDLDFANCNNIKDSSVKKISNKYKEDLLIEEKKKNDLLKEKYSDELNKIKAEFLNFKDEYNI